MKVNSIEDILQAIEAKRIEKGLSERQLSKKIGKCSSAYWWTKEKGKSTKLSTVLKYMEVLGLKLSIS